MNTSSLLAFVLLIISGICGALFLNAWHIDKQMLDDAANSRSWPVAKAIIRYNNLDEITVRERTGRNSSRTYEEYKVQLGYEYKVGGKRFESTRITLNSDHYMVSRQYAIALSDKFRVGTMHYIHYNPKHPGESIIIPGVDPSNTPLTSWIYACATVFFFSLCIFSPMGAPATNSRTAPSNAGLAILPAAILAFGCSFVEPNVIRANIPDEALLRPYF